MRKTPRIVVVGSSVMDLTTFTDRFPRPGETVLGTRFDLGFGGKGANQAAAARLCGAEVSMVSKVGDDLFGAATIDHFRKLGIGVAHVGRAAGRSTGAAPIFVDPDGQNRIVVVPGANDLLTPADVQRAAPVLAKADRIVLQLEIPLNAVYAAVRLARANSVPVILNPAPAPRETLDPKETRGVEYLIPNETEGQALSGMPVRGRADAEACADRLLGQGFGKVVLTMGSGGALFAARGRKEFIPAFPVEAKDTTGAGDAFIGSFAAFLTEGLPELDALRRAGLYAALSTTRTGTQKSFPTRRRFDAEWARRA